MPNTPYVYDAATFDHDLKIVQAMAEYGGSFVKALAYAWRAGDIDNQGRIKATWPEYWEKYAAFIREDLPF